MTAVSPELLQHGVIPVDTEEEVYDNYFGFDVTETFTLPKRNVKAKDQHIYFKVMSEGDKSKFQKATGRDVVLERSTGNARMNVDPATERHSLIVTSVTGWDLRQPANDGSGTWKQVQFSQGPGGTFEQWLNKADPKVVEELESCIRKANPWLQGEATVADIDKEIANLQEQRELAVKREAGNVSSSDR